MKLLLLILPLFFQYWEDSDVVSSFKKHVSEITLVSHEGRAPGSEGEKEVAEYVWEELSKMGVDMLCPRTGEVFGMAASSGDTLVSRNVIGMLQGYDAQMRNQYVVIGARMDNTGVNILTVDGKPVTQIYAGANGNASGVAMLIELAGMLAKNSIMLKRSIVFVAFGSSTNSFAGAWHFLHNSFAKDADKIDAMINLDMLGLSRDGFKVFSCGNADINTMLAKLSSSLQPVKPQPLTEEPYPSDHQVFYANEIPSVLFTTGRYSEHNTPRDVASILDYDFMEKELEYLYNFTMEIVGAPKGIPSFGVREEEQSARRKTDAMVWSDCDIPPTFLGNSDPNFFLHKWVYTYLKYPQDCIKEGISGRVLVEFIITKEGNVEDVTVVRSVDPRLDMEAVKVVKASPKWKPGRMHGMKQNCSMTIPVEFRLKKKK